MQFIGCSSLTIAVVQPPPAHRNKHNAHLTAQQTTFDIRRRRYSAIQSEQTTLATRARTLAPNRLSSARLISSPVTSNRRRLQTTCPALLFIIDGRMPRRRTCVLLRRKQFQA